MLRGNLDRVFRRKSWNTWNNSELFRQLEPNSDALRNALSVLNVVVNFVVQIAGLPDVHHDFGCFRKLRDGQADQLRAEVRLRLDLLPAGQRIRHLRAALGWTQRMAAVELGIV
jgi:hypothetical protein